MARTGATKPRSYSGDYMEQAILGEEVVREYLVRLESVKNVKDLRDNPKAQEHDIDFEVEMKNGDIHTVEVKTDQHIGKTGNVVFEISRINHTCHTDHCLTKGWSGRSAADYVFFVNIELGQLFLISMAHYRKAFQVYTRGSRKKTRIDWVDTDTIKSTVNILMPESYVEKYWKVQDVSNIVEDLTTKRENGEPPF